MAKKKSKKKASASAVKAAASEPHPRALITLLPSHITSNENGAVSVDLANEGSEAEKLDSIEALPDLLLGSSDIPPKPKTLVTLNLAYNVLAGAFFDHFTATQNSVGLGPDFYSTLTTLNIAENRVESLDGVHLLTSLERLNGSGNLIKLVPHEISRCAVLKVCRLSRNSISTIETANAFSSNKNISELCMSGNPVCTLQHYRPFTVFTLSTLFKLDEEEVTAEERHESEARFAIAEMRDILKSSSKGPSSPPPASGSPRGSPIAPPATPPGAFSASSRYQDIFDKIDKNGDGKVRACVRMSTSMASTSGRSIAAANTAASFARRSLLRGR